MASLVFTYQQHGTWASQHQAQLYGDSTNSNRQDVREEIPTRLMTKPHYYSLKSRRTHLLAAYMILRKLRDRLTKRQFVEPVHHRAMCRGQVHLPFRTTYKLNPRIIILIKYICKFYEYDNMWNSESSIFRFVY